MKLCFLEVTSFLFLFSNWKELLQVFAQVLISTTMSTDWKVFGLASFLLSKGCEKYPQHICTTLLCKQFQVKWSKQLHKNVHSLNFMSLPIRKTSFSIWPFLDNIQVVFLSLNHSHKKRKDSLEKRGERAVLHAYVENQAILEPILLYRAWKHKKTK